VYVLIYTAVDNVYVLIYTAVDNVYVLIYTAVDALCVMKCVGLSSTRQHYTDEEILQIP
jgi:hypothetical protein